MSNTVSVYLQKAGKDFMHKKVCVCRFRKYSTCIYELIFLLDSFVNISKESRVKLKTRISVCKWRCPPPPLSSLKTVLHAYFLHFRREWRDISARDKKKSKSSSPRERRTKADGFVWKTPVIIGWREKLKYIANLRDNRRLDLSLSIWA